MYRARGLLSRIVNPRPNPVQRRLASTHVGGSAPVNHVSNHADAPLPTPKRMEGLGEDPRPPWVYVGTRLISLFIIPVVGVYSIFWYDFGDKEHVFQPIRRWTTEQANAFLSLSPAEEKLLKSASAREKEGESSGTSS